MADLPSSFLVTRIYETPDGGSCFEDIHIPLDNPGWIGTLSAAEPVKEIIFRETQGSYDLDFHNAPSRRYIIITSGSVDITTTDGVERRFDIGSVLKVEDVGGRGHKSKAVDNGIRKSIFLILG